MKRILMLILLAASLTCFAGCPDYSHLRSVPDYKNMSDAAPENNLDDAEAEENQ